MHKNFLPYKCLGIAGLIFLLASLFLPKAFFDIEINGTYYVFTIGEGYRYIAVILLALFTISSFAMNLLSSRGLSWLHVVFTVISILILLLLFDKSVGAYKPGYDSWPGFERNNRNIQIVLLSTAVTQLFFLLNTVICLIKNWKNGS